MDLSALIVPESVGPVSQLFFALISSLINIEANISPASMWPADVGPTIAGEYGPHLVEFFFSFFFGAFGEVPL